MLRRLRQRNSEDAATIRLSRPVSTWLHHCNVRLVIVDEMANIICGRCPHPTLSLDRQGEGSEKDTEKEPKRRNQKIRRLLSSALNLESRPSGAVRTSQTPWLAPPRLR